MNEEFGTKVGENAGGESEDTKVKKKVMRKVTKQDILEANNILEEVVEIFEPCVSCGLCKGLCPTFKILLVERISARGFAIKLSDKVVEKAIYECTLCGACDHRCPVKIPITEGVVKAREVLHLRGKNLDRNNEHLDEIENGLERDL